MRRRRRASGVPTPLWRGILLVLVLRSLASTVAVLPPPAAAALVFVPPAAPLHARAPRAAARATTLLAAASHIHHHHDTDTDGADPPAAMQPRHVAIIPDGNGRWAQRRGLPRAAGHQEGAKRAFEVLQACQALGGIEVSRWWDGWMYLDYFIYTYTCTTLPPQHPAQTPPTQIHTARHPLLPVH